MPSQLDLERIADRIACQFNCSFSDLIGGTVQEAFPLQLELGTNLPVVVAATENGVPTLLSCEIGAPQEVLERLQNFVMLTYMFNTYSGNEYKLQMLSELTHVEEGCTPVFCSLPRLALQRRVPLEEEASGISSCFSRLVTGSEYQRELCVTQPIYFMAEKRLLFRIDGNLMDLTPRHLVLDVLDSINEAYHRIRNIVPPFITPDPCLQ